MLTEFKVSHYNIENLKLALAGEEMQCERKHKDDPLPINIECPIIVISNQDPAVFNDCDFTKESNQQFVGLDERLLVRTDQSLQVLTFTPLSLDYNLTVHLR